MASSGDGAEASPFHLSLVPVVYELFTLVYEFILYLLSYQGEIFLEDAPYFIFGFMYCALILACSYFAGALLLARPFQKDSKEPKEI